MNGSVFGFGLDSEVPLTRLRDERGRRGALRIELAREPLLDRFGELTAFNEPRDGLAGFALARAGSELVAWCSATGSYLLDPARGRLAVEPATGTTPAWEHRLLASVLPIMLAERGDLVLHAAAVVVQGRAILLCGPAGRGKSTLALTLGAFGTPVMAEDGVVLTIEGGAPIAWPGPRGVRLKDASTVAFARSLYPKDPALGTHHSRVALQSLPEGAEAGEPVPVGAVVALGERGAGLSVEPLTRAEALPALVQNLFHAGRSDGLRPAYRHAARLAALVPAFRAALPDDLDAAADAAARMLERVALVGGDARRSA